MWLVDFSYFACLAIMMCPFIVIYYEIFMMHVTVMNVMDWMHVFMLVMLFIHGHYVIVRILVQQF